MTEAVRVEDVGGLAGLDGETVVVVRDEWGIPHVRAESARGAFFGQGYAQAEDRLGQLEYDRRRARGTWAELAGPAGVRFDAFARRCGLAATAAREADALGAEARAVLDAFAAGVNAYLSLDRPLPPDLALVSTMPERWDAADCCAVFLVRHVVFANWQKKLWRGRLATAIGADAVARLEGSDTRPVPLVAPPPETIRPHAHDPAELDAVLAAMARVAEPVSGSNSWALHGSHTASGKPLVAGDPHRFLEVPGVYYQCHLTCDELDAIGLAFVGVPGMPHFGHNEHVAWCVTNANGDYQDLFVEDADAIVSRRDEEITVRDAEPVVVSVAETATGPVVFGGVDSGAVISLRSTALVAPSTGLSVVLPMLRARDVGELDDAMRTWVDPVNNFVSADVAGDIAYRTVGQIPVRSRANAWGPVPADAEHEWSGLVAAEDMPSLHNPASGRIVTANQRIVGDEYPHYLGLDYSRPDRARRIHARLDELDRATAEDMAAIHRDLRSLAAEVWVPRIIAVDPRDDWERAAVDVLRSWDHTMDRDSVAATVYVATRDAVCRRLAHHPRLASVRAPLPDEPPGTFQPLELRLWALSTGLLDSDDTTLLGEGRTWDDELADALTDAVGVLRTSYGDDVSEWRWGMLHRVAPRHPLGLVDPSAAEVLDPPTIEVGGEWDTVMCAAHPAGHGFGVTSSSVARYVFDLSDWDRGGWIVPLGASGVADSPHFADQQVDWSEGRLVPMRYSWSSIEATASRRTVLRA